MKNIFDIINPKMFNVFMGKDRRTNFELLYAIFLYFTGNESRPVIEKEELVRYLSDIIKERIFDEFEDEEGQNINNKTAREKSLEKIKQFRKNGWIDEDITSDFSISITLDDNALIILESFKNIMSKEYESLESSGYIITIYTLLNNFDSSKSTATLEQMYSATRNLLYSLQGLNTTIKKYLQRLINKTDSTANEILDVMLKDYQQQVVVKVFSNLKSRDNPNKYTDYILETLYNLLNEKMNILVSNFLETKRLDPTKENYMESEIKIQAQIKYMINQFEYLSTFIEMIDDKNSKFLNSAKSKLLFILNNNKDFEGQIIAILKAIKKQQSDDFDYINLQSINLIDEKSTSSPRFLKEKPISMTIEEVEITHEDIKDAQEKLYRQEQFSIKKINELVLNELSQKSKLYCHEFNVSSHRMLLKMMLIQIYSSNPKANYQISYTGNKCVLFQYSIDEFLIERKEE